MKAFFFSLFLILPALSFLSLQVIEEERDKSLIYWDERPLTWKDFKGKAPKNTEYAALTHSAIKMVYGGEGTTITFIIETVFYPKTSWKIKEVNDFVLKHEQGHFDITEYHSRLLRKDIHDLTFKKQETIAKDIDKLFKKYYKAAEKMQDQYDKETNHSLKKEEQERWNQKITDLLNETASFSQTKIELDVSYLLQSN